VTPEKRWSFSLTGMLMKRLNWPIIDCYIS
jgi:hypothetical protein